LLSGDKLLVENEKNYCKKFALSETLQHMDSTIVANLSLTTLWIRDNIVPSKRI